MTAETVTELVEAYDVEKIVLDGVTLTLPSGQDGYTPQKGVDYYTNADQEDIVQQVITALGTPVFGTVNDSNVITLSGELADGIYTIQYEDADGTYTTVGVLDNREVAYTNVLASATNENDEIWRGVGYADGYRLQSYGGTTGGQSMTETEGYFVTGLIPYTMEQLTERVPFYVKGIELDLTELPQYLRYSMVVKGSTDWYGVLTITDMTAIDQTTITQLGDKYYKFTPNTNASTARGWSKMDPAPDHIRFSMPGSGVGVIITINEPIE